MAANAAGLLMLTGPKTATDGGDGTETRDAAVRNTAAAIMAGIVNPESMSADLKQKVGVLQQAAAIFNETQCQQRAAPEAIPAVPETTPTVPAVDEAIPPSDGDETTGNHPMMLAEGGVGTAGSLGTGPGGFFQGASL